MPYAAPLRFVSLIGGAMLAASSALSDPVSVPVFQIPAHAETDAVQHDGDAADDAEIWRNAASPEQSRIFATDKKRGLMVLDTQGEELAFFDVGRLNNVDLREGWTADGASKVLIAASDRTKLGITFFLLDPASLSVDHMADSFVDARLAEPYGLCLYRSRKDDRLHAFVIGKEGEVRQFALAPDAAGKVEGTLVRSFAVGSISEGCVADDRTGHLYVAEETRGIWRYGAEPDSGDTRDLVAAADATEMIADIEGLTLAAEGETGGYLIASVQGNSSFALLSLPEGKLVARFQVTANDQKGIDAVTGTDGVAIALGNFGADLPDGLLVVQDDDNAGQAQNFKLVSWSTIRAKLGAPQ